MAEKDLLFGGTNPAAAENYVKAGRGFDKITMPSNLTHSDQGRGPTPMQATGEYPDQPLSRQAPGGSSDTTYRKLRRATGLPYPDFESDGGRDNGMRDLTDPKYR